jgi:hypothetical protein
MKKFIEKYRDEVNGVLSGFDRLVFRGSLRRLNQGIWSKSLEVFLALGMEQYLSQNSILMKDYGRHVKRVSDSIKLNSLKPYREQDLPVKFLRSSAADKEAIAREVAAEKQISHGLVCAISTLEPSPTFEHRGKHIIRRERPCHVLYHYQIDPEMGWMHARLQTWFPFNVQIAINGREWLARQMDRVGLKYRQQGNCFVWIEDYQEAQKLMDEQLQVNWAERLNPFAQKLNPLHAAIFQRYDTEYYWTCYQSEWATDVVFEKPDVLKRVMRLLVPHGMSSFSSPDVMRYFGKKVNQNGTIPANFTGKTQIDLRQYREGERVKFKRNGNSIKFYDKAYSPYGSVLRAAETTLNKVQDFRVFRPKEGGPEDDLQWRPMRMGIADLNRRAEVSQKANERLMDALASVDDTRRVEELTAAIQLRTTWKGRPARALRPWADDKPLLVAIHRGGLLINGFRNRDLQAMLYDDPASTPEEKRRRSAAISRKLRLLRAHGLIEKVGRTNRYQLTFSAGPILVAVLTTARTSVHELNQVRQAA